MEIQNLMYLITPFLKVLRLHNIFFGQWGNLDNFPVFFAPKLSEKPQKGLLLHFSYSAAYTSFCFLCPRTADFGQFSSKNILGMDIIYFT